MQIFVFIQDQPQKRNSYHLNQTYPNRTVCMNSICPANIANKYFQGNFFFYVDSDADINSNPGGSTFMQASLGEITNYAVLI